MGRLFNKSTLAAAVVAVAVAAWILTGSLSTSNSSRAPVVGDTPRSQVEAPDEHSREQARLRVSVFKSRAMPVTREVGVSGQTEPNRIVEIRAEVEGRVTALYAERGARIRAGAEIARLDARDRTERVAKAEALIAQHRLQYEAAERLRGQSLVSEAQIAEARARLISSQAELAEVEVEIANTRIRAPFDAVVQERFVEIGDFVRIGDEIALLVDTDPLIVSGDVAENEIGDLTIGQLGKAILADGAEVTGEIRYVAPIANEGTRTFKVELAVPNPDGVLRGGISAELKLAASQARGHLIPPSVLTLDDFGTIGVKVVDAEGRAQFHGVELLSASSEGVWISGLPDEALIISVGQGFVTDGQLVEPVMLPIAAPGSLTGSTGMPSAQ